VRCPGRVSSAAMVRSVLPSVLVIDSKSSEAYEAKE